MINHDEWLIVGLITSPQGINGKIKIKSLSDFEERFTEPGKRWIQKGNETPIEFELTHGFKKPGKESFIITLKGINNRTQGTVYKLLHATGEYVTVVLRETNDVVYSETFDAILDVKAVLFVVFKEDVDFVHTPKQVMQITHYILISTD